MPKASPPAWPCAATVHPALSVVHISYPWQGTKMPSMQGKTVFTSFLDLTNVLHYFNCHAGAHSLTAHTPACGCDVTVLPNESDGWMAANISVVCMEHKGTLAHVLLVKNILCLVVVLLCNSLYVFSSHINLGCMSKVIIAYYYNHISIRLCQTTFARQLSFLKTFKVNFV